LAHGSQGWIPERDTQSFTAQKRAMTGEQIGTDLVFHRRLQCVSVDGCHRVLLARIHAAPALSGLLAAVKQGELSRIEQAAHPMNGRDTGKIRHIFPVLSFPQL
jgi:hypothetical protein